MAEALDGPAGGEAAFGARLRRARLAAGLTQEELAERAGLSARGIQDLERGLRATPQRQTVRLLGRALGLAPEAVAALEATVVRARRTGPAAGDSGPEPAGPPAGGWLPRPLTSFVGREQELAEVGRLLGTVRLLTLTGPGGVGKTRLALELAADASEAYPDGVRLVALAALAEPALVLQTVAAAVGVREEPGGLLPAALTDALRPKRLLLVLDNCEHLVEACARLADALLRACPLVTILATSREALNIAGETVWPVPPLPVPPSAGSWSPDALLAYDAVRLFVERAGAAVPAFALSEPTAAAVAAICARLDGLPLALELAAARARVLGVAELLARLDDRYRLLTGGGRTAAARHRTLEAAVAWSYELLPAQERTLFARLAVFAGGFTLAAAEAVGAGEDLGAPDVLDLLTRLVDQSLVAVDAQPDGTVRYRLLETLRAYARDKLAAGGLEAQVRDRHAGYYTALADRAAPQLRGPDSAAWHDRMERELDNVRAALGWAAAGGPVGAGLRLATALFWFWYWRRPLEGRAWLARLLARPAPARRARPRPPGGPDQRARALVAAAQLALAEGDLEAGASEAAAALALARRAGDRPAEAGASEAAAALALARRAGDRPAEAAASAHRAAGAHARGEDAAARALWEAVLERYRDLGDRHGIASALRSLAGLATRGGDAALAEAHFRRALALLREAGDRSGEAGVLGQLGDLARGRADAAGAHRTYAASLACFRAAGDPQGCAVALGRLAGLAAARGEPAAARAAYADSLRGFQAVGRRLAMALTLGGLAAVAGAEGRWARALRLAAPAAAGAARPGAAGLAWIWGLPDLASVERVCAQARLVLRGPVFAAAWAEGQAMSLDEAVAYALADAPAPG